MIYKVEIDNDYVLIESELSEIRFINYLYSLVKDGVLQLYNFPSQYGKIIKDKIINVHELGIGELILTLSPEDIAGGFSEELADLLVSNKKYENMGYIPHFARNNELDKYIELKMKAKGLTNDDISILLWGGFGTRLGDAIQIQHSLEKQKDVIDNSMNDIRNELNVEKYLNGLDV